MDPKKTNKVELIIIESSIEVVNLGTKVEDVVHIEIKVIEVVKLEAKAEVDKGEVKITEVVNPGDRVEVVDSTEDKVTGETTGSGLKISRVRIFNNGTNSGDREEGKGGKHFHKNPN